MNPFSYGTIVQGDYFYDRKEECERIVSTLSSGNNLVLFAPRRYGKTSLVFDEFQEITKLNKYGFENLLRSKIQQQQNVNYLFLGSQTHLLEIVISCTKRIVELKSDYYYELFDRQSVMQKQLLKALVKNGENIFSADYTKRFRLSTASTTQKAVLVLMDSGIIDKTGNAYFIGDLFFKRFIQNYAS